MSNQEMLENTPSMVHLTFSTTRFSMMQSSDITWVGDARVCRRQLKHFSAFSRSRTNIERHSFVWIVGGKEDRVAYIEDLYETPQGTKMARVRWFNSRQEVEEKFPNLTTQLNEIFFTYSQQELSAERIDGIIVILEQNHFNTCLDLLPQTLPSGLFVCHRICKRNRVSPYKLSKLWGYCNQPIISALKYDASTQTNHEEKSNGEVEGSNLEEERELSSSLPKVETNEKGDINEVVSDSPIDTDMVVSEQPIYINKVASEQPIDIDMVVSEQPIDTNNVVSEQPVGIDMVVSEPPVHIDMVVSEPPVHIDMVVSEPPVDIDLNKVVSEPPADLNKVVSEPRNEVSSNNVDNVEYLSQDSGLRGCWFRCKVLHSCKKRLRLQYLDNNIDDGDEKLEETVPAARVASPDKLGMRCAGRLNIRPWPFASESVNSSDFTVNFGDSVDAWWCDGWWEGIVIRYESVKKNDLVVYFPGENKLVAVERKNIRVSRDWIGNQWVDIKEKPDILSYINSRLNPVIELPPLPPLAKRKSSNHKNANSNKAVQELNFKKRLVIRNREEKAGQ